MSVHIESKAQYDQFKNGSTVVVVDFTASWCPPCHFIAPKFEEFAKAHPNMTFVKVDVDECRDIASEENISAMPTFKFYQSGTLLFEMLGANVALLQQKVEEYSSA
jgi:thioredoxin 1